MRSGSLVLLCLALVGCARHQIAPRSISNVEMTRAMEVQPLEMHKGVWKDVAACLGEDASNAHLTPLDIKWIVADSIYIPTLNAYVYGVTIVNPPEPGRRRWTVIIEGDQWMYPHTPSHEMIHVLANQMGHPPRLFACQFPSKVDLPYRVGRG